MPLPLRRRDRAGERSESRSEEESQPVSAQDAWIVVTSDLGEGGMFGPVAHDKVFEVPFVEGRLR